MTRSIFPALVLAIDLTTGCSRGPDAPAGDAGRDVPTLDVSVELDADTPPTDSPTPMDAGMDAVTSADAPADAAVGPTCTHRFEAGEIVLIEPYLDAPAGVLRIRLAQEIDWALGDYDFYSVEEACIVVPQGNQLDGLVLDEALDDAYWNATTGRAPREPLWLLDMVAPPPSPRSGLIVRGETIPTAVFPGGLDLDVSLGSGPGHFAAWYNPDDEFTEPTWVGASARPIGVRHYPFGTPPGPPVEGHPFTWSFTHTGDYFVRVHAAVRNTAGVVVEGAGLVHFVVE